uniref:Uncharacterized protein n=1 Tax=Gopherus agassizii TaxID=38772 RepID=A0A452IJV9_9SAUR
MSYFVKEKASSGFLTSIQGNCFSFQYGSILYRNQKVIGRGLKYLFHKQDEISIWDYAPERVREKQPCGLSGIYSCISVKGYPPTQQRNGQHIGELGSPGGDFPLATGGFPPRAAFLMPIKFSKNRGQQSVQNPPPDICILTLAMMIAGIPTVPVPGIKEEDLIRAAQNFMTENLEQGIQGEITPKRTGDVLSAIAHSASPAVRSSYQSSV